MTMASVSSRKASGIDGRRDGGMPADFSSTAPNTSAGGVLITGDHGQKRFKSLRSGSRKAAGAMARLLHSIMGFPLLFPEDNHRTAACVL